MDYAMSYGAGGGSNTGTTRQTTPGRSSRQTTPALSGGSLTPNAYNPSVPSVHRIAASGTHTHTIILLHGRNSSGDEFESELFMGLSSQKLTLEEHFPSWKWVFPSSPERFSTVFQEPLEQWFDVYSLTNPSLDEDLQKEGLQASCDFIRGIVEAECREVPPERIVLGGISMGAATALHALLLGGRRLGGLVGLCGWCPFRHHLDRISQRSRSRQGVIDQLKEFYRAELSLEVGPGVIPPEARYGSLSPPSNSGGSTTATPRKYEADAVLETPVFLSHSVGDEVVEIDHGRDFRDTVAQSLGMNVTWREYERMQDTYDDSDDEQSGEHWIREPEGFDDLVEFMERIEQNTYLAQTDVPAIPSSPRPSPAVASAMPPLIPATPTNSSNTHTPAFQPPTLLPSQTLPRTQSMQPITGSQLFSQMASHPLDLQGMSTSGVVVSGDSVGPGMIYPHSYSFSPSPHSHLHSSYSSFGSQGRHNLNNNKKLSDIAEAPSPASFPSSEIDDDIEEEEDEIKRRKRMEASRPRGMGNERSSPSALFPPGSSLSGPSTPEKKKQKGLISGSSIKEERGGRGPGPGSGSGSGSGGGGGGGGGAATAGSGGGRPIAALASYQ